jgi:phosphonopyruvate decarboxylase
VLQSSGAAACAARGDALVLSVNCLPDERGMAMLPCELWYDMLVASQITFFTGVPDSLLKDFSACLADRAVPERHVIAANEGNAVALACGYYLATGQPALVYMQNSGLGNAINPLTSLIDPAVYRIPVLLLIGWRGEPGRQDEPQHSKQGRITLQLLETLEIDYNILPQQPPAAFEALREAVRVLRRYDHPYALVVRDGTFEHYTPYRSDSVVYPMTREEAVSLFAQWTRPNEAVVATTGKASRELFEWRREKGQLGQDFFTVGSMGHASQIALGIALSQHTKAVYCLDGDGALIMHMGALSTIGSQPVPHFKHVVLNNGVHDSVGGQPTAGFTIDLVALALACGYKSASRAATAEELIEQLDALRAAEGPALLEVRVRPGARADLGRPTLGPQENKKNFMYFLQESSSLLQEYPREKRR